MDKKALYVAKANARNLNGYSSAFEVVAGRDVATGELVFETITVPNGKTILLLTSDLRTGEKGGSLVTVRDGLPPAAAELQPNYGDEVRITCTKLQSEYLTGSSWRKIDDGTFVDTSWALEDRVQARLGALEARVPLPPPAPTPLPAEG